MQAWIRVRRWQWLILTASLSRLVDCQQQGREQGVWGLQYTISTPAGYTSQAVWWFLIHPSYTSRVHQVLVSPVCVCVLMYAGRCPAEGCMAAGSKGAAAVQAYGQHWVHWTEGRLRAKHLNISKQCVLLSDADCQWIHTGPVVDRLPGIAWLW